MIAIPRSQTGDRLKLSSELLLKYDQPVPRYTSYPTVLKLEPIHDRVLRSSFLEELEESDGPLSLYFHLPFCQSLCWFCGCAKVISTDTSLADRYIDHLEAEVSFYRERLRAGRKVAQVHFGGGTPNFLSPLQIGRLKALLRESFDFAEEAEVSVEIDPRTLTEGKVAAFVELGVNRASIGVQDVNPVVQRAIHRIQPTETNRKAIACLRSAGVASLNVDLIYGLPHQTEASFRETLEEILSYDPDRLAIFSYAHVPWSKPSQRILERAPLPSAESKIEIFVQSLRRLERSGYRHKGMDHFAKESDSLARAQRSKTLQRNFQGYSLRADVEICAFGMSAISQSKNAYRQNHKNLDTYYAMTESGEAPLEKGYRLSEDDRIRREVIMRLMCDLELDFAERGRALGIDFRDYFRSELESLEELEQDGLVEETSVGLAVTDLGRLLIRNVASRFDAYLGRGLRGFSKAI